MFLKMWEKGLVYRATSPVNWCPNCKTVLANEQVVEGRCWRCGTDPEKRELAQWYYKITDYAQELLDDLDKLEGWPENVKAQQRNWIGRSEGAEIDFTLADTDGVTPTARKITVFTTRADTLFGVSFFLLPPESPLAAELVAGTEYEAAFKELKEAAEQVSWSDRQGRAREARRLHGPLRHQPRQRPPGPRLGCRLRRGSTTAPAPSWAFPAATSATSTSPEVRPADCPDHLREGRPAVRGAQGRARAARHERRLGQGHGAEGYSCSPASSPA